MVSSLVTFLLLNNPQLSFLMVLKVKSQVKEVFTTSPLSLNLYLLNFLINLLFASQLIKRTVQSPFFLLVYFGIFAP